MGWCPFCRRTGWQWSATTGDTGSHQAKTCNRCPRVAHVAHGLLLCQHSQDAPTIHLKRQPIMSESMPEVKDKTPVIAKRFRKVVIRGHAALPTSMRVMIQDGVDIGRLKVILV